jgi:hypothetical protein
MLPPANLPVPPLVCPVEDLPWVDEPIVVIRDRVLAGLTSMGLVRAFVRHRVQPLKHYKHMLCKLPSGEGSLEEEEQVLEGPSWIGVCRRFLVRRTIRALRGNRRHFALRSLLVRYALAQCLPFHAQLLSCLPPHSLHFLGLAIFRGLLAPTPLWSFRGSGRSFPF